MTAIGPAATVSSTHGHPAWKDYRMSEDRPLPRTTTYSGIPVAGDEHSLTVGATGPTTGVGDGIAPADREVAR
jgi:hypothetical protein